MQFGRYGLYDERTDRALGFRLDTLPEARQAKAARVAQQQEHARHHLQQDFPKAALWRQLASAFGIRLPAWYVLGTDSKPVLRAMHRLRWERDTLGRLTGLSTTSELAEALPGWPAWALVGLVLELHARHVIGQVAPASVAPTAKTRRRCVPAPPSPAQARNKGIAGPKPYVLCECALKERMPH